MRKLAMLKFCDMYVFFRDQNFILSLLNLQLLNVRVDFIKIAFNCECVNDDISNSI